MKELDVKHGFAIKRITSDGKEVVRLRPSRGSDGWSIWKTRRNAEAAVWTSDRFTESVIPVTMRLELRQELEIKEESDAAASNKD